MPRWWMAPDRLMASAARSLRSYGDGEEGDGRPVLGC